MLAWQFEMFTISRKLIEQSNLTVVQCFMILTTHYRLLELWTNFLVFLFDSKILLPRRPECITLGRYCLQEETSRKCSKSMRDKSSRQFAELEGTRPRPRKMAKVDKHSLFFTTEETAGDTRNEDHKCLNFDAEHQCRIAWLHIRKKYPFWGSD